MRNRFIFIVLLVVSVLCQDSVAQVGIGTNTPNSSAQLDISASNKGLLPPRIGLSGRNDASSIASPASGLLIYNTATASTGSNKVTPGYYYYNGSSWERLENQDKERQKDTVLLNTKSAGASISTAGTVSAWSADYTASGGDVKVFAQISAYSSGSVGLREYKLMRDGTAVATGYLYFNNASVHHQMSPVSAVFKNESGLHTYAIRIESNLSVDQFDSCLMTVTESNIP
jgi:hypothetical protein